MKSYSYFSCDIEGDFAMHDTEDQARAAAKGNLENEQDRAADDGWHYDVEGICWGELRQRVVQTQSTPTPGGRFDSMDEYELIDIKKEPT